MQQFANHMKRHAEHGHYTGVVETTHLPYFRKARKLHQPTGTILIYTRDIGHHSSGWFKNPDYERCYHLSLSFFDPQTQYPRPFDSKLAKVWIHAFFGDWTRYIWEESMSDEGRQLLAQNPNQPEVRHYRVFCNPVWQPIIPRDEVYTRDFIEKGWKSWSDQQYDKQRGNT
jgi:hypothetical protein